MYKKIVLIVALFGIVISGYTQSNNDSWLKTNFHQVSTKPANTDYSDLQFLKKELHGKTLVAIGEQTHLDGKTFEGRSRLIQFLIKEMGFEAIIFESGIYDVKQGWKTFKKSGDVNDLRESLFTWKKDEQNNELFSFIKTWQQSGNKLSMAGFDCKFTSKYRKKYARELDSILHQINPKLQNNPIYVKYNEILEDYGNAKFIRAALPNLSKKETKQFTKGSKLVRTNLKNVKHSFLQTVITMDEGILLYSKMSLFKLIFNKKAMNKLNNGRDILMADNLNYLLENEYKNKKVILFGASYHFIKNNDKIITLKKSKISIPESIIMGNLLKAKYNKDIYTIGFTAYGGSFGTVSEKGKKGKEIKTAESGSLEKILFDNKLQDGILILNNNKKPDWWYKNLSIRLFSYESKVACSDWSEVIDAVFYIENMEPQLIKKQTK